MSCLLYTTRWVGSTRFPFAPGRNAVSALQKFAWFNLAVIALTVGTVAALFPLLGSRALGGTGFLGLLGLGVLFFRRRPGQVLLDERDHLIQQRSWVLAHATFWVVYVLAAALLAPAVYGSDGGVP